MNFLSLLKNCRLCPRDCKVNRLAGCKGFCGCDDKLYVARAALHMWEEPCISGDSGSGTVFFSGCTLKCVFCQNEDIANSSIGKEISITRLAEIFLELQSKGANNINLVTPTHYAVHIKSALELAKQSGLTIPIVYNTSGYEKPETLKLLHGLIDIYLPDFKYYSNEPAKKYSFAGDYFERTKAALKEMYRQTGPAVFDEHTGIMKKGIIVRHLVLPGCINDSKYVIKYLYENYGNNIYMSIMNQYTPMKKLIDSGKYPELAVKLSSKDYDSVVDYAINLGVENAFVQEGDVADESFIPRFDYEGV